MKYPINEQIFIDGYVKETGEEDINRKVAGALVALMNESYFQGVEDRANTERAKYQSLLVSKELCDIHTPVMLEDIKDLVGDNVPRDFMQLVINIYTVAYIRGKQDVMKIIMEEGMV